VCVLNEPAGRGKVAKSNERTHQGKACEGRKPMQTLEDDKEIWKEMFVD